ncbi:transposable element Tc1 transposase [Trichonephila clavipes]|uniref:Transposable element Tc1 transposase n=1 Tax=Trichonephila clavipes TaxID=2585209 RepID=A0A8X6SUD4_TRICX|nr:transposable element Tc1 transposase [Trichonephila clavipes]
MAKFSYLPENKRYKIIHLKEDGYSMRQIAAKVPCGLSTVISNVRVCPRTVRGRLLEIGLRGCKAHPKPLLTEFQRKRRLTWAMEHSLWTIKDWEKEIFSDESQFCISGNQSSAYDDNAPCHRAKVVQKWLKDHTLNRMNWPGQSPDLNRIENLCLKIGYEISKKKPSNNRKLIEALIFSFNHIVTKDLLLKLLHSMPQKM